MTVPQRKRLHKLTGKKIGWWYVIAYAGERDGVRYWQCMCRGGRLEKVVAEPDILNRKTNALHLPCPRLGRRDNLVDCIFGRWTVLGLAGRRTVEGAKMPIPFWKCRCACGTVRGILQNELTSGRTLSCGCQNNAEILAKVQNKMARARKGISESWRAACLRHRRTRLDHAWTAKMERAIRSLQPTCINCGGTQNLATHHVLPVSKGGGLKPGNAVRLCRECNSFASDRTLCQLTPEMARKIEAAAAHFKEFWDGQGGNPDRGTGRSLPATTATAIQGETPTRLDPTLRQLLHAIAQGDDSAIEKLTDWLKMYRPSCARKMRCVIRLAQEEIVERAFFALRFDAWERAEAPPGPPGQLRQVDMAQFETWDRNSAPAALTKIRHQIRRQVRQVLAGQNPEPLLIIPVGNECLHTVIESSGSGEGPHKKRRPIFLRSVPERRVPLPEYVCEQWKIVKLNKVWDLLTENMSWSERGTLQRFLGMKPDGAAESIEQIAQSTGKKEQTIRLRVGLALHKLTNETRV